MSDDVILSMEGIVKSFGVVKAISNGYLSLKKGEIHALMGENGAGKSTLMNILSGSLRADEGKIIYLGKEVSISSPIEAMGYGIAMIHQELQLVPELTVGENIFLGREPLRKSGLVDYAKMFEQTKELTDALNLAVSPKARVRELRVGEQQLIEIIKATSLNAKIVIMDEPTSALSKAEANKLFEVANRLRSEGVSIIYITHRIEEVFEITDRITVMRDGLYIATLETASTQRNQLINLMVGREFQERERGASSSAQEELLRVEEINLKLPPFSKKSNLSNISFTLGKGEVLGIAGLMGSGRSELLECLFGLHPKSMTGRIYIHNELVNINNPQDAIKHKVAFLTEDRKGQGLVLLRSIGENMSLPILKTFSKRFFMNTKEERPLWDKQMKDIRIKAPSANTLVSNLSGGNQQKVIVGRWLLTEPEVLLMDEPTRGIDVGAKEEVYQLISMLAAMGKGIMVVSSELPELLNICDRIITFCEGRLTGNFLREEADQEILLSAATMREEALIDA